MVENNKKKDLVHFTMADQEIKFKARKVKNFRQRKNSSDDEQSDTQKADDVHAALTEAKFTQKLRTKPNGINAIALAAGKKVSQKEASLTKDPFKMKTGGIVDMKSLKVRKPQADEEYDAIGTQFSAETNKRDEDEEMMKYIEDQLDKRKNANLCSDTDNDATDYKYMTAEDAALQSLPEHLRSNASTRSEEMLSNQMLNGIPEVDLGIDAKIKNIELTEAAKEKLIQDQRNRKTTPSQFVPANMAVNFVQHKRFNIHDNSENLKRQRQHEQSRRQQDDSKPQGMKRATDDFYYEKFRKQFRR